MAVLLGFAFLSFPMAIAAESKVLIAEGGEARLPIVISPKSSADLRKTAAELASVLERMTGASFLIEESSEVKGITVGTLKDFPAPGLEESLAIRDGYDGIEAFAIETDKDTIRLLGQTDLGVSHAVFRFLDLLGCRWYFPGSVWEILPRKKDLSFGGRLISRPAIWTRDIWFGRTAQRWEPGDPNGTDLFNFWKRANLLGQSLKVNVSHRWHALPKEFPEEFAQHPEYFALAQGKREGPQLCVTNPGLQNLVVESVARYFAKNPSADMASLDPADWPDWCTCPDCQKLGHQSNQAFYLANLVAKKLQKSHPGKFVGLLAYSWHSDAPPFVLEPNVYVQLTAGMNASKFTFEELFKLWGEKCAHLGIYEYYSYWQMDRAMLPGTGVSNQLDELRPRMQKFVSNKVNSISAQAANCWGVNGLGYYLAARLMWDPTADVDALKKEFYENAFGPAAKVMARYYERLNLSHNPLPGAGLLRSSLDDLEAAVALAASRPDVQARLQALQESLVYNALGLKVAASATKAEEKIDTLEWFTWAYRTRNNYMNDWITFRSAVGRPSSEKFEEPDWFWRNTTKTPERNPWRVDVPVTTEELNRRLAELKRDLGPPLPEDSGRTEEKYVLIRSGLPSTGEVTLGFRKSASFLLASRKGEPLQFEVEKIDTLVRLGEGVAGFVATRDISIEAPDAAYALTDGDGKEIQRGRLSAGRHDLALEVSGPGVYRFDFTDDRDEWRVRFPANLPNALIFQRGKTCRPEKLPVSFFSIPAGTSALNLYGQAGGTLTVNDSQGTVVFDDKIVGGSLQLPVAETEAAQVWSLSGKIQNLWFFDVPTVLSPNPEFLFVPAPMAKADHIKIEL